MSQKTPEIVADKPRSGKVSHEQRVLAARIRVKADKHRGVDTPKWIVDLAAQKAS